MVAKKCYYKYYFSKLCDFQLPPSQEVFINYTQNKVIQLSNNAIVKRNNMFKLNNIFIEN